MKTKDLNIERFLTVQEFADIIRVHSNTIRKGIRNGHIQAFKTGIGKKSSYRIPTSEVSRMSEINLESVIDEIIEKRKK